MKIYKFFLIYSLFFSFLFAGKALESAKVYIKDKNWAEAEKFLLEALDHPKDRWEAAFHLGDKIYPRSNNWGKVAEYLSIADTANDNLKIRPTRNDRKISIKQAVIASRAKSYQIIYNRAAAFNSLIKNAKSDELKQNYLNQGINSAMDLREFDPLQPGGYGLLAQFYISSRNKEGAIENVTKLIKLPNIPEKDALIFFSFAGEVAQIFEEYDLAADIYEQALELDANNYEILADVAVLYSRLGEHDKAINSFLSIVDELTNEDLKSEVHYNLGASYIKINNLDEAAYHFEEAYILNPEDEQALFGMAIAFEESKLYRKARKYYREAQKLNPSDPRYQQGISRTQIKEDQEEAGN